MTNGKPKNVYDFTQLYSLKRKIFIFIIFQSAYLKMVSNLLGISHIK